MRQAGRRRRHQIQKDLAGFHAADESLYLRDHDHPEFGHHGGSRQDACQGFDIDFGPAQPV